MSSFTDPLELEPATGDQWRLTRQLDYEIGKTGSRLTISIPVGFTTDLTSVPRLFWSIFNPQDPRYAAAAVLHDWLCQYPGFNQRVADALFQEALGLLGVPAWQRLTMYYAVRLYMTIRGDATARAAAANAPVPPKA